MTREEIYDACLQAMTKSKCLLLESATGTGKTKIAINLVNNLCDNELSSKRTRMLLLVAKRVHKTTWRDEIKTWGGLKIDEVVVECYESLHKHTGEHFDVVLADEVHHIGSDKRTNELDFVDFDYFIGLSATIPRKVKAHFRSGYHSQIVSCTLNEAIEDDVLPEPKIVLLPLQVENTRVSETIELNPKSSGPIIEDVYNNIWKYKRTKQHAILKCTQRQKLNHINSLIDWEKKKVMAGNVAMEKTWLYHCGKRLELLADWKVEIIRLILNKLKSNRTITFCKTIEQAEKLGRWCIHSKNGKATQYYDDFNAKKIHHITAVNILNENANLVDCKYALFCNLSSSEIVQIQRVGRALRHKSPVILIPYYEGTREEEIVKKSLEGFSSDIIRTIHSINEL